jgi:ketosteroid isomerase-like protein
MGAKENLAVIEDLRQAAQERDWDRYGCLLAHNAVFRMAGVPRSLGGVTEGRDAVIAQMRQTSAVGGTVETRDIFADDNQVCVISKLTAPRFQGNDSFRAAEKPFSTFQCVVYRIDQGKVTESTNYVNWLDVYTQVGLIDPASLTP